MQGAIKIRNDEKACKLVTPNQLLITSAAGPTQVTSTVGTLFRIARIYGVKDLAGTSNVGSVKLGWSSSASQQPIVVTAGSEKVYEAPVGASHDLSALYLTVANAGDGVVVIYS